MSYNMFDLKQVPSVRSRAASKVEHGFNPQLSRDERELARFGKKQNLKVRITVAQLDLYVVQVANMDRCLATLWHDLHSGTYLHGDGDLGRHPDVGECDI